MLHSIFYTTLLFLLSSPVFGYKIDASCTKAGIETDIRRAMVSSFQMVDSALAHLDQNPWDIHTTELVQNLFTREGSDARQTDMSKVRYALGRIRDFYRDEVVGGSEVSRQDVVIYCDHSRFELVEKNTLSRDVYRDTVTRQLVSYRHCFGFFKDILGEFVALAVTSNPSTEYQVRIPGTSTWRDVIRAEPSQIQICPWFVDWVKSHEFKLHNDVARSNIGRVVVKLAESFNFGLKQIDAFSLLDKVLLHEMTHARTTWNHPYDDVMEIGLDDVPNPKTGLLGTIFGGKAAYGWKGAQELANFGEDVRGMNDPLEGAADNNADSVALFGSACKLLDDTWSRKVDAKGRIVPNV